MTDVVGTAEGETPERPSPAEHGRPGTPGAAEPDELHRGDAHHPGGAHLEGEEHDAGHDDHGAEHDDHAEPRLGPIDWPAWGAGALGVAIAGVMAVLFYLAVAPR